MTDFFRIQPDKYFRRIFWVKESQLTYASSEEKATHCTLEVCNAGGFGWQMADIAEFEWPKDKCKCEMIERGLLKMFGYGTEEQSALIQFILGVKQ